MHQDIADRLTDISSRIQKACRQAQRSEDEVRLVAVSKLQSVDIIKEAYALPMILKKEVKLLSIKVE